MTPTRRCRSPDDAGMATVEAAITIFALVLTLSSGVAAVATFDPTPANIDAGTQRFCPNPRVQPSRMAREH